MRFANNKRQKSRRPNPQINVFTDTQVLKPNTQQYPRFQQLFKFYAVWCSLLWQLQRTTRAVDYIHFLQTEMEQLDGFRCILKNTNTRKEKRAPRLVDVETVLPASVTTLRHYTTTIPVFSHVLDMVHGL
jgi:hypothetical protein